MTEEEWNDLTKDQQIAFIVLLGDWIEYWSNLEEEEEVSDE